MPSNIKHTENELLITRFLSNKVSETEKKQVINLLQTDNKFKELYLSIQKTVNAVDALLFYDSIDEEKALNEIYSKAEIKEKPRAKLKQIRSLNAFLKIASIIILVFGIGFLLQNRTQQVTISSTGNILSQQILPDSSIIDLNINSSLQYSNKYGIRNRTLKFSGEAYFSVRKNAQLPFIVDCDGLFVEVTGTTFTISNLLNNKQISVFVNSGQVKVYDKNGKQETLNPGDIATYNRMKRTLNKSHVGTVSNINSWLTQKLTFEDCPLQQVIDDVNNYYKVDIQLSVTNIQNCRLSAKFENASLESVLEIICLSFGLEIINNGTLTLKGDGC